MKKFIKGVVVYLLLMTTLCGTVFAGNTKFVQYGLLNSGKKFNLATTVVNKKINPQQSWVVRVDSIYFYEQNKVDSNQALGIAFNPLYSDGKTEAGYREWAKKQGRIYGDWIIGDTGNYHLGARIGRKTGLLFRALIFQIIN